MNPILAFVIGVTILEYVNTHTILINKVDDNTTIEATE